MHDAEIVAVVVVGTVFVFTVNVAFDAPAATAIEPGTVAAGLFEVSITTTPSAGASPLRVTVAVDELPAVTLAGLRARDASEIAGWTVSGAVTVAPL